MQTVQTKFRCCKMRCLIRVCSVCLQEFLCRIYSSKNENVQKTLKLEMDLSKSLGGTSPWVKKGLICSSVNIKLQPKFVLLSFKISEEKFI